MKILSKMLKLSVISITTVTLTSSIVINAFDSSNLSYNNKNIINSSVLLYSFDYLFILKLKQDLEDIQKENNNEIQFTFYDGKNNIAVQNETLDSVLKNNVDLIILNLASIKELIIEDIIYKVKQKIYL